MTQLIIPAILFFCITSCANTPGEKESSNSNNSSPSAVTAAIDTLETGRIISTIYCKADAAESYALYIPIKGKTEPLPVIYFFDPHGAGELPLTKYKSLADLYGFVLVGSHNSKNGNDWPDEERTWNNLFNDVQQRVKVDTRRIYVCGFSGGAKVATVIGLNHHEVKTVIANGAGLPEMMNAGDLSFSFTAITGTGDMNMTDLVSIINGLDKGKSRHRIIFFNGKHEWAPQETMKIAFAGLQLDAMREKIIPADNDLISHFITDSKKRIDSLLRSGNYTKAASACQLCVQLLEEITEETSWFIQKDLTIRNSSSYKDQNKEEENLLVIEQKLKSFYAQQFENGNMNYWIETIHDIQTKARSQNATGAMYQRLQAYLSLAFYSISNQLIQKNQNNEASHFVELYKLDDATNSEAWYFSAVLNARNNNAAATEKDLLKAVKNGFNDKNRMMQQPEFKGLPINFPSIIEKVKK